MPDAPRGFFPTFNALVDGGHLVDLDKVELVALLGYMRRMNADNVAWPSCDKLGLAAGYASRPDDPQFAGQRIRAGRQRLIARGFLVKVAVPESDDAYRVVVPERLIESINRPLGLIETIKPGANRIDSGELIESINEGESNRLTEQTIEGTNEQTTAACDARRPPSASPHRRPASGGVGTTSGVDASPVVLVFPCNGRPAEWQLHQSLIDEFSELYPPLDVPAECLAALGWVRANTKKTHRGMRRFLTRWMIRSNNRPSMRANGGRRTDAMVARNERALPRAGERHTHAGKSVRTTAFLEGQP